MKISLGFVEEVAGLEWEVEVAAILLELFLSKEAILIFRLFLL